MKVGGVNRTGDESWEERREREREGGGQEGKGDKSRRKLYYTTHFATKYYL